eukprot:gene3628-6444_t
MTQRTSHLDPLDHDNEFNFDSFEQTTNFKSISQFPFKGDEQNEEQDHTHRFTFGTTDSSTPSYEKPSYYATQMLRHHSLEDADKYNSHVYWKSLYLEEVKKNEKMNFEKESFVLIIKTYSQTISNEEYALLTKIPSNLKQYYDSLTNKEEEFKIDGIDKKFMEMNSTEFVNQILLDYPEVSFVRVKFFLEKRNESLKLLKEFSDEKLKVIMSAVDQLLEVFYDYPNEGEKIKQIEAFQHTIMEQKEECKNFFEREFIQFIEKTMKGKNNPLPDDAKKVLRDWFLQNFKHPYPTDSQKNELQNKSGLTRTQVNNWFINKRVRVWRPLIQKIYPNSTKIKANHEKAFLNSLPDISSLSLNLNKEL